MNIRNILCTAMCLIGAFAVASKAGAAEVLYDQSGFVAGQQSFVLSFDLPDPGMLTVSLANVAWPQQLASLDMVLSSASGMLAPELGVGTETFKVKGGMVYDQWFGTAQGPLDLCVYSMKVQYQPNVVPLPASIALFASGLLLLAWQRRQRKGQSPDGAIA